MCQRIMGAVLRLKPGPFCQRPLRPPSFWKLIPVLSPSDIGGAISKAPGTTLRMCWPVRHDRSVTLAFSQCWSGHIWSRPSGPSEKGDCCHEAQKPLDLFEGKEVPHFEQGSVFSGSTLVKAKPALGLNLMSLPRMKFAGWGVAAFCCWTRTPSSPSD